MLERFLERISSSEYKSNFILKGGILISAMVGIDSRTTLDLDATIKGQFLTEDETARIIRDILEVQIDDNVIFTFKGIEAIREDINYPGYRISIDATFEN